MGEGNEDARGDTAMDGDSANDLEVGEALEVLGEKDGEAAAAVSKTCFVDYLRSPIIEVAVGMGDDFTLLTAHEALLQQSPFFAAATAAFSPDATTRRVEFPTEHLDAMGAFLEFLYTGEYTPRKLGDHLEGTSPRDPLDDGAELLRHARVYTLAEKLGVGDLKALAHSKVHLVNSSAKGEIAYARYVYANTPKSDMAIRRPIASFWGQRSHVLRHGAEEEFRTLCIEFPEFGYDVLSYVLDVRERKSKDKDRKSILAGEPETPKTGRKRARHM